MNLQRKIVIAGNWKMNMTYDETLKFLFEISEHIPKTIDTIIFPQFTSLHPAVKAKIENLRIGAQNMHYLDSGAYTGEVSPINIKQIGVTHVLIGHSERRQYFGETNDTVNLKLHTALRHNLTPILCIGENLEVREKGTTYHLLAKQLTKALEKIPNADISKIIIAYEPIWAIGTGRTATSLQANEAIHWIRERLKTKHGKNAALHTRILYGGSVNTSNIQELLKCSEIDGVLVGGSSLKSDAFKCFIDTAIKLSNE